MSVNTAEFIIEFVSPLRCGVFMKFQKSNADSCITGVKLCSRMTYFHHILLCFTYYYR